MGGDTDGVFKTVSVGKVVTVGVGGAAAGPQLDTLTNHKTKTQVRPKSQPKRGFGHPH
jgi:hypothetical protein